ncbi:MAG: ABC transporter ATP-binding protein [Clostridia bacterium]|nr:ABC transporter ATP-binding protein [Clostridia bacterium]
MANVIECTALTKKYGETYALNGIDFAVPATGGIVGLLGPNGSGKTTLIKLLTGFLTPTSGNVKVAGKPVGVETKSVVSYLSDAHALNNDYTVMQEIEYFADFFSDFDREKALRMMVELGVDDKKKVKTLSKGTKEKLALLLTLSRNARLYILDEPIAGVDPAARDYILKTILANKAENATVLMSTHLISEIEEYFDYIVFLKQGNVVLQGEPNAIRQREGKSIDELFREIFKWM